MRKFCRVLETQRRPCSSGEYVYTNLKSDKNLANVAVRDYRSNLRHVKLLRRLLEADHLINLPILKTYASMVFSCALKNVKGVVQDAVHFQMPSKT